MLLIIHVEYSRKSWKDPLEDKRVERSLKSCNHFHNILRLFDVLPNFPFTTSETIRHYYL